MKTTGRILFTSVLLASLSLLLQAQNKQSSVQPFGVQTPERGIARVGFWDGEKNQGAGGFFIEYGRPLWRKDYEDTAKFDSMTKGQTWRMGAEYWTVLDTSLPLRIGNQNIPVGQWYLGLHRSADGAAWSLVFIDPAKARSGQIDPSEMGRAPVAFKAPMKIESGGEFAERLTITLSLPKAGEMKSVMRLAWGKFQLSAPIQIKLGS